MKKVYGMIIICSTFSIAQENSLLNEMIDKAIETHPKIQIEDYNIQSVEKDVDKAYGGFYPKVDVSVDYGKRETKVKPEGEDSTKTKFKGTNSEISITQNLFNGFSDSSILAQNKENLNNKTFSKEITVLDLTLNVANSYSLIVKYRKLIEIQQETLEKFKSYNEITLKNSELTGKQTDYYLVNSKLEKLKSDLIET